MQAPPTPTATESFTGGASASASASAGSAGPGDCAADPAAGNTSMTANIASDSDFVSDSDPVTAATSTAATTTTATIATHQSPLTPTATAASPNSQRPPLAHRHSSASSQVSHSLSDASSSIKSQLPHHNNHPHLNNNHNNNHHPPPHHHHHHHHSRQHKAARHHGRLGSRNTSFGHNLNKLSHGHASLAKMPHDAASQSSHAHNIQQQTNTSAPATPSSSSAASRPHHLRSKSGDPAIGAGGDTSAPTSPRVSHPQVKRNASAFVISRNHSHTALKKNHSSGHLPRNLSGKALSKVGQHRAPHPKRKHSGRSEKSVPASPVSPTAQPTVRFALADEPDSEDEANEEENEWTEESTSVSPNVTRDNTRRNSLMLDPDKMPRESEHGAHDFTSGDESTSTVIHAPEGRADGMSPTKQKEEERGASVAATTTTKHINGESSYKASTRVPTLDADAITSRLLQRKVTPKVSAEPLVSSVSATVQPDANDHRSLSHSQASTLAEGTPGRDLVSRFVNANSNEGTPREGNMLPRRAGPAKDTGDLDASKRNRSAPNMAAADKGPISPTVAKSRRSGTHTPTDLPPSRTQQKLLLQRASSAIEPTKHIPAVLPRPGAAQLLGHGLSFTSTDGGTPAQVHALFAQINKEYNVVRRYRSPVADAVSRLREIPHPERDTHTPKSSKQVDHDEKSGSIPLDRHCNPEGTFKVRPQDEHKLDERTKQARQHQAPQHDERRAVAGSKSEERGHRSRVSFDLPSARVEDTDEEDGGSGTMLRTGAVRRDATYELCRRMWEMGEPEGLAV
ncbi:uncharacterized protein PV09_04699 [Verruconis gallopava]|uniref:Uncharacterized protein n=1 Tax=Verruconis gallopava TaxID=253628 RepID=A0A0D2AZ66_9PEZI|nr:uncharacterized protein PV09_04699 [Verruconis gallopava]KIW04429.1 hypothetical protein PV09_04699 [Verruconis gallopava]